MRIAVISDIHSNLAALQAVLADVETQMVDEIIVAGDAINGGPNPREVLDIIYERQLRMVVGNHEQYVIDVVDQPPSEQFPPAWGTSYWTVESLTSTDMDFLRGLPRLIELDDLVIMHASPKDLWRGFYLDTTDEEIVKHWDFLPQRYRVTAHTHRPLTAPWQGKMFINPGAVGMPLDRNPMASYVILSKVEGRFIVQHRRVAYDIAATITAAEQSGLLDPASNAGHRFAQAFMYQMETGITHIYEFTQAIYTLEAQGLSRLDAIAQAKMPHYSLNDNGKST